jgi:Xaa-Pro aminopeptidase
MKKNSIAFFNSNDIYPISADSTLPFEQHRDIFYLSGIDQEESILVISNNKNYDYKEMLFIRETNDHIIHWEGEKLTKKEATEVSGINTVHWLGEFDKFLDELIKNHDNIYINTNEHYRQNVETETREDRFIKKLKKIGGINFKKSNPILQKQRSIKDPIEIELIKKACEITKKGFERVLSFVKPGVWEYEIEAEFSHEFLRNKSKRFAYTPIIASGINSNYLHYIKNNKQCQSGEIILMDVGAEYANYSSDMTRTIPVNGRFTTRQKTIYQAVLNVKKNCN